MKEQCYLQEVGYNQFEQVIDMFSGKWKLRILYTIAMREVVRYGVLKKHLSPITHKMLSTQLKELEADGLIKRTEYPQVPPKVEYSMTQKGRSLEKVANEMLKWNNEHNK